jgi:hypothetical protein
MKISDILKTVSAIKQGSQSTNTSKMSEEQRIKALARDAQMQQEASKQLDDLLQKIEQENDPIAAGYIKEIFANRGSSGLASPSSQPVPAPHPDDLYQKILPLCQLAYLEEQNGTAEDHALKLSLIFENEKAVYDYLIRFPEENNPKQLVHDACLFDLPAAGSCDFLLWKKIAAKHSNMKLMTETGGLGRICPVRPLGSNGTANPLKTKIQIKSRHKCNI